MTSDLIAFITARLDEDERTARRVLSYSWELAEQGRWEDWEVVRDANNTTPPYHDDYVIRTKLGALRPHEVVRFDALARQALANHLACFGSPARVLREVEAKRGILRCQVGQLLDDPTDETATWMLQHLASVWADHPDYRAEWAP